jgi:hypothetical protein
VSDQKPPKEIAYYYPNPMWKHGDWVKSLIVFFDGVALLVPGYMKDKPELVDPAIVAGLKEHGLLYILQPEQVVDAAATAQLATALTDIITSGVLDDLSRKTDFHELSMSRLGYNGDSSLAEMIFDELKARGLAKNSEDGKSIPMHPMVRSLVLVLLSQILRSYGPKIDAELSPITDRPKVIGALSELLEKKVMPSTGSVIAFDLQAVGVDLGSIPIDEILDFRQQHLAEHRRYCTSVRRFSQELSKMPDGERETAFDLRQAELDDLSADLRKKARKAWRKPAALAMSLTGAAVSLAAGHPLAAALSFSGSLFGYTAASKPEMGAYSYLFRASGQYYD